MTLIMPTLLTHVTGLWPETDAQGWVGDEIIRISLEIIQPYILCYRYAIIPVLLDYLL